MKYEIADIVFLIQKLNVLLEDPIISDLFKAAVDEEIYMISAELETRSVRELVDFIKNFEGF